MEDFSNLPIDFERGIDLARQLYNACLSKVGPRKAGSPWTSFKAVCCRHNGEGADTRMRGGLNLQPGALIYNCFNCQFKTGWRRGQTFSRRFQNLLTWFGIPDVEIKRLNFVAWQIREMAKQQNDTPPVSFGFKDMNLPTGAKSFTFWLSQDKIDPNFLKVVDYLQGRGEDVITQCDWHWTPELVEENGKRRSFIDRVIIPFKWNSRTVGWTARSILDNEYLKSRHIPRYIMQSQPNYLFNTETIRPEQKYIIICEGPFDALAINGVATLGNHLSTYQCDWLNNTGKTIVVLPDREKGGGAIVDVAIKQHWHVSFPKWLRTIKTPDSVKDASEAAKTFGRIFPLWSVLEGKTNEALAISVFRQICF